MLLHVLVWHFATWPCKMSAGTVIGWDFVRERFAKHGKIARRSRCPSLASPSPFWTRAIHPMRIPWIFATSASDIASPNWSCGCYCHCCFRCICIAAGADYAARKDIKSITSSKSSRRAHSAGLVKGAGVLCMYRFAFGIIYVGISELLGPPGAE